MSDADPNKFSPGDLIVHQMFPHNLYRCETLTKNAKYIWAVKDVRSGRAYLFGAISLCRKATDEEIAEFVASRLSNKIGSAA